MQPSPKSFVLFSSLMAQSSSAFVPTHTLQHKALSPRHLPSARITLPQDSLKASTAATKLADIFTSHVKHTSDLKALNSDWLTPEITAYAKLVLDLAISFTLSTKTLELCETVKTKTHNDTAKVAIDLAAVFLIVQCLNLCSGDIQNIQSLNESAKPLLQDTETQALVHAIDHLKELLHKNTPPLN